MQKVINHLPLQDECSGIAETENRIHRAELRRERPQSPSVLGGFILAFSILGMLTTAGCVVALIVKIVRHFLTH